MESDNMAVDVIREESMNPSCRGGDDHMFSYYQLQHNNTTSVADSC